MVPDVETSCMAPQTASYRSALGILVSELCAVSAEPAIPQQDYNALWRSVCLSLEVCLILHCVSFDLFICVLHLLWCVDKSNVASIRMRVRLENTRSVSVFTTPHTPIHTHSIW